MWEFALQRDENKKKFFSLLHENWMSLTKMDLFMLRWIYFYSTITFIFLSLAQELREHFSYLSVYIASHSKHMCAFICIQTIFCVLISLCHLNKLILRGKCVKSKTREFFIISWRKKTLQFLTHFQNLKLKI